VAQDLADGLDQVADLVLGQLEVLQPGRGVPALQAAGREDELGQVIARQQVQRLAEGPDLDEATVLPQCIANVGGAETVDAGVQLELCGAHDLRVHADELAGHVNEAVRSGSRRDVLAFEAEGENLLPARGGSGRIGALGHRPDHTGKRRISGCEARPVTLPPWTTCGPGGSSAACEGASAGRSGNSPTGVACCSSRSR
jgi:hypothetical protein